MPIEYALKAIIPPVFYIDALMVFLRKEYYISYLMQHRSMEHHIKELKLSP